MQLNLTRPLIVFDLETTGIIVGHDRIVELCLLKIMPDGSEEELTMRLNPQVVIPPEAIAIHGITNEDIHNKPTFGEVAQELLNFIGQADLAGFNSNRFDVPMLMEEFLRADIEFSLRDRRLIDVQNIFHKMEPRTLKGAYKFYCKKDLIDNHSASADTRATYEILKTQLDYYNGVEYRDDKGKTSLPVANDLDALHKFSIHLKTADLAAFIIYNDQGKEIFNFGKHKGQVVEDIIHNDLSYYKWILNSDFPRYTKRILEEIKNRKK